MNKKIDPIVSVISRTKKQKRVSNNMSVNSVEINDNNAALSSEKVIKEAKKLEDKYSTCIRRRVMPSLLQKEETWDKRKEYVSNLISYVKQFEKLFNNLSTDLVFLGIGPFLSINAIDIVSNKRDIKTVHMSKSKMSKQALLFHDNYLLNKNSVLGWPNEVSQKHIKKTKKLVRNKVKNKSIPEYVEKKSLVRSLKGRLKSTENISEKFIKNPIKVSSKSIVLFAKEILKSTSRVAAKMFRKKPDKGEDFLYLPLHHPVDTQILYRGEPFMEQEFLVRHVARNLPQGCKLYVKEHPNATGLYSSSSLQKISSYIDINIVGPHVNTHSLIQSSSAVITINSTTGLESIMHNCPVVTFGSPFYASCDSVFEVKNLFDTSDVIRRALRHEVKVDKNLRFLTRLYRSEYKSSSSDLLNSSSEKSSTLADIMIDVMSNYCGVNANLVETT